MTGILQYQSKHQPWCRIFHNPAMTTECWCDSQIAGTAYKLGLAEGMGLLAVKMAHEREETEQEIRHLESAVWALQEG